jgi:succinate dehydrogenase/fumarate reductase flavoprotein subunit
MPNVETIETDVLVIGGGLAGVFAAVKATENGANVTLVDKGYVSRTGQTPFAHCMAVFDPKKKHTLQEWLESYPIRGEYLNNRLWTETVLKDSYARYKDLVSWGIEFIKDEKDNWVAESLPELPNEAPIWLKHGDVNFNWIKPLRQVIIDQNVNLLERIMITQLLEQEGQVVGAIGFSFENGTIYIINAKATILCAGAAGFKPTTWPINNITADGHIMAYKVGAEITGKEFADFHGAPANPQLKTVAGPAHSNAPLLNTEGEEVINRGPTRPLDMDFNAHAGKAPLLSAGEEQFSDAANGMSVHTQEGIWATGLDCSSGIPGLYAAGDNLATMMVGANYTGMGNATATSSSTGARAGTAAAEYSKGRKQPILNEDKLREAQEKLLHPLKRQGGFSPAWVTQQLQNCMKPYYVSRIKHGERLKAVLTLVEFYRDHLVPQLYAKDTHDLRLAHETENMVINAEMRLRSALFRTESRGTHYREDFPLRDDKNWLCWVMLKEVDGEMKLYKKDIPEEWHPDSSIPYEERYPIRFPGESKI